MGGPGPGRLAERARRKEADASVSRMRGYHVPLDGPPDVASACHLPGCLCAAGPWSSVVRKIPCKPRKGKKVEVCNKDWSLPPPSPSAVPSALRASPSSKMP